jgi:hypothetical protein
VGGIGICYFLALSAPKGWFRRIMYVTAGLCALGVVAAHARGAFLAAMTLFAVIWLRSPRKGATLVAGIAAAAIVIVAASMLFEEGFFWNEMMSVFEEGTAEGTGEDRWELWMAAVKVFQAQPIFGTGPRNWGVYAALNLNPLPTPEGIAANLNRDVMVRRSPTPCMTAGAPLRRLARALRSLAPIIVRIGIVTVIGIFLRWPEGSVGRRGLSRSCCRSCDTGRLYHTVPFGNMET